MFLLEKRVRNGHLARVRALWYQIVTMSRMPNVHVRDVPPDALDVLRDAARRHGRSLNAEIVDVLVKQAEREQRSADLVERLGEARRRWKRWFPDGFPPGHEPETTIRRERDTR